jgi:hypothetical protein
MDRRYEMENLRRSLAMLQPGQVSGLRREEAITLIEEVQGLEQRLEHLKGELRRLVEDG